MQYKRFTDKMLFSAFQTDYEYLRPSINTLNEDPKISGILQHEKVVIDKQHYVDLKIFCGEKFWSNQHVQEIQRAKKLMADKKILQENWMQDGELLRLIYGLVLSIKDDSFYRKMDRFIEMGKTVNWSVDENEINILKSGHVSILGRDKHYRPVV